MLELFLGHDKKKKKLTVFLFCEDGEAGQVGEYFGDDEGHLCRGWVEQNVRKA
jgi:hypothetical protein